MSRRQRILREFRGFSLPQPHQIHFRKLQQLTCSLFSAVALLLSCSPPTSRVDSRFSSSLALPLPPSQCHHAKSQSLHLLPRRLFHRRTNPTRAILSYPQLSRTSLLDLTQLPITNSSLPPPLLLQRRNKNSQMVPTLRRNGK